MPCSPLIVFSCFPQEKVFLPSFLSSFEARHLLILHASFDQPQMQLLLQAAPSASQSHQRQMPRQRSQLSAASAQPQARTATLDLFLVKSCEA
ncbi:hypothetical protein EV1_006514 [Malus domestica]